MFIGRRLDGTIYGAWSQLQAHDSDHQGIEEVEDTNTEYVVFRDRIIPPVSDPLAAKITELEFRMTVLEGTQAPTI